MSTDSKQVSIMATQWKAQLLRFTVFLSQPALEIDLEQLWVDATGSEPDNVNSQPKRQLQVLQANIDGYRVALQAERERLDLVFQPPEPFVSLGLPELGPFELIMSKFKEFVHIWLNVDEWPDATRIAVGATLFIDTTDLTEARRIMLDMVPSLKIDEDSDVEDLLFQINRPRLYSIEGQEIRFNRLAKWSAVQLLGTLFSASTGMTRVDKTSIAVLELDINTPIDAPIQYDAKFQDDIVDHLVQMAVEISIRGDVE
jgi:hypothetical protein